MISTAPQSLYHWEQTRYMYRRLDGLRGRSGRAQTNSLPPGFDPRTVQPIASRYTDYDFPAAFCIVGFQNISVCGR